MRHCARGFSLIEALVAMFILSVGLLGIASLQLNALKNNHAAMQRSVVTIETHAIVDAMRAERGLAMNGHFNVTLGQTLSGGGFAAQTIADWQARLAEHLGSEALGAIVCNGVDCSITVQWNESRATQGASNHQITTQVQL